MVTTEAMRREWAPACTGPFVTIDLHGAGRIQIRAEVEAAFRALNACLVAHDYRTRRADTGAYNCRRITGGTGYSLHAYGIAADLNWTTNPYGRKLVTDFPPALIAAIKAIRTRSGATVFRWGGDYATNKDAMHFEVICTRRDLASGIDPATVPGSTPNAGRTWVSFSRVGTTDAQVYAAGGLDNEIATVQLMLRHPVTRTYTKADADAVKALKKIGRYIDPSGKADRSQAVTPDFAKVLAALSKVQHP